MTTPDPRAHLAFALDVPSLPLAEPLLHALAPVVGCVKVGLELFLSHGPRVVEWVRERAPSCRLFLDLKLHDVPETVRRAAAAVAPLAPDYLTVHAGDGEEVLRAAVEGAPRARILGITVLTSVPRGPDTDALVLHRARAAQRAGAAGVVCSAEEASALRAALGPDFLLVTPGIRPAGADAHDQRRIATPASAIRAGSSLLVIGRPLRDAPDPAAAASRVLDEIAAALGET